ncbi:dihydroxyacetone kinase subunit DhaK [Corynebacterium sp. 11A]|uniref:dihydroxyacetone kinase subunit DhaK n=1 Tax=Corynebacterium sp. 11A TaxID=2080510 RepID=UPI00124D118F|nr:dihydroxyacetone kinase subunit DhaK [Corynebacterium sp. 11A]
MKKLMNDPHDYVAESIAGFAAAHSEHVQMHTEPLFVSRSAATRKEEGKVGLISGGGSGHEPLHAGFVGTGMLDAAVPGAVFTSPTPDPIQAATVEANRGAGVVYLVKNYTGDVLNFDTAAELAELDDIEVRQVLINDDVAVEDSLYTAGRRGVAGTLLVEKITGAAAERGDSLDEVVAVAETCVAQVRSMGVALSPCHVPHADQPSFELAEGDVELGVGIHGEPGRRTTTFGSADELTDAVLDPILADLSLAAGEKVIALVNGMGGTPLSELYIVYRRLAERLTEQNVTISRSLVGNYVTSLDMQGFSISLMRVDEQLLALYDAPAHTPAFTH